MEVAPILESLARVAKTLLQINPAVNGGQNSQTNALLFGAIIASGTLPFTKDEARRAIESQGLAVVANLAGLETGLGVVRQQNGGYPQAIDTIYDAAPAGFEEALASLPDPLRPVAGHALARLVDYQDANYARQYLARLTPILEADEGPASDYRLTREVARRLAAWMCHEDIIRVAQLKTRPGRLERIRQEVGARPGEPVEIVDFLSPGREEASGLLPAPLFRLLLNGNDKTGKESNGLHLSWPTSSPWGYAVLKFLASLRALRPHTLAYTQEQLAIETWLVAVCETALVDYDLACQVAELAAWARGYGNVRARGLACLENLFENWEQRLHENPKAVKAQVQASLHASRNDADNACKKGE
jgi:indolepyruvate ferredoxin oxidoreductase beta subunit